MGERCAWAVSGRRGELHAGPLNTGIILESGGSKTVLPLVGGGGGEVSCPCASQRAHSGHAWTQDKEEGIQSWGAGVDAGVCLWSHLLGCMILSVSTRWGRPVLGYTSSWLCLSCRVLGMHVPCVRTCAYLECAHWTSILLKVINVLRASHVKR